MHRVTVVFETEDTDLFQGIAEDSLLAAEDNNPKDTGLSVTVITEEDS